MVVTVVVNAPDMSGVAIGVTTSVLSKPKLAGAKAISVEVYTGSIPY